MKCIRCLNTGRILRVTDAEATKATRKHVNAAKWVYVPKSEWKAEKAATREAK